jgi:RHS repeat-associated protein
VDANGIARTYTYDADGNLTEVHAPDGGVTTLAYAGGLVSSITEPGGRVVTITHSGRDLTGIVDAAGNPRLFAYDDDHHLTEDHWAPLDAAFSYDPVSMRLAGIDRGLGSTYAVIGAAVVGLRAGSAAPAALGGQSPGRITDALLRTTSYGLDGLGRVRLEVRPDGRSATWQLDGHGLPLAATDFAGLTTQYRYDDSYLGKDDLLEVDYPDGTNERFLHDPTFHHVTSHWDQRGAETDYAYDGQGNLVATLDPLGRITVQAWADGLLQSVSDPDHGTTLYLYDSARRVAVVTDPLRGTTVTAYDPAGNVLTEDVYDKDGNLQSDTTNVTDGDGRVRQSTDGDLNVTTDTYDPVGDTLAETVVDHNGNLVRARADVYDRNGNLVQSTDGDGNVTVDTYDVVGRLLTEVVLDVGNRVVSSTSRAYDRDDNLVKSVDGDNNTTTYSYDADGNELSADTVDAGGAPVSDTSNVYDADGRVLRSVNGDGNTTSYTYDGDGNLLTEAVFDQGGHLVSDTSDTYDADGELVKSVDGDSNTTSYTYDGDGNVLTAVTTDAGGNVLSSTSSTYDKDGNLIQSIDGDNNTTSYTYDGGELVYQETRDAGGNLITAASTPLYDKDGNPLVTVDGDGNTTTYAYDGGNLVSQVTTDRDGNVVSSISSTYDKDGNLVQQVDGDRNTTSYAYDGDRLAYQETRDAAGNLISDSATPLYDKDGNPLVTVDGARNTTTYAYDGNRLVSQVTTDRDGNVVSSASMTYDRDGNLIEQVDGDGNTTSYAYDGDRLVYQESRDANNNPVSARSTPRYDGDGNLLESVDGDGNTTTYAYDGGNLVSAVTTDGGGNVVSSVSSTYDKDGNLIRSIDGDRNTTSYTFDGGELVYQETRDANGNLISDSSTPVHDQDGNPLVTVDGAGNTTTFGYDGGNLVSQVTADRDGRVVSSTSMTYDKDGNLVKTVDGDNNTTSYAYDGDQLVSQETRDAGGNLISKSSTPLHDEDGNPLETVDGDGNTTTYAYDGGRLVSQVTTDRNAAVVSSASSTYDRDGNLVRSVDGDGNTTSYAYDGDQLVYQETRDAGGNLISKGGTPLYDQDGRPLVSVDGVGNTATYAYDGGNLVAQVTTDLGGSVVSSTSNTYDQDGNLVQSVDGNNNTTSYVYDGDRLVSQETRDAHNNLVSAGSTPLYDPDGNPLQTVDGDGNTTAYAYDGGRLVSQVTTDRNGAVVRSASMTYDQDGNLVQSIDGDNNTTTFVYDGDQLVSQETRDADNNLVSASSTPQYDADGNPLVSVDGDGNTTTLAYDGNRLVSRVTKDPAGRVVSSTSSTYDKDGNLIRTVDGDNTTTSYTYDGDQLVYQETRDAGGNLVSASSTPLYDLDGKLLKSVDGDGNVTLYAYDGGRLVHQETRDPQGNLVTQTINRYDPDGNLVEVIDADGYHTLFAYDAVGHQVAMTDPLGHTATWAYDLAGRLVSSTDRDGRRKDFTYDGAGRVLSATWYAADGTTVVNARTYTYDRDGNLLTASDNGGTYSFTYDGNRVRTQTDAFGLTLTFTYDPAGNRTLVQDSLGGQVQSVYDGNQLVRRTFSGPGQPALRIDLAYDAAGNMVSQTRYADVAGTVKVGTSLYAYDGAGRVTAITHQDGAGNTLAQFGYVYDPAGRLTSQTVNGATTNDTYDAVGELTASGGSAYSYDGAGNRTMAGYQTGPGNQLLSDGTWDYAYDNEGNLVRKIDPSTGVIWAYAYDHDNHLVRAVQSWNTDPSQGAVPQGTGGTQLEVDYRYDVFGNRIERQETDSQGGAGTSDTRFAYDGPNAWADLDGSDQLQTRRLYLDGADQLAARVGAAGAASWYLADRQGSVVGLTDAAGALADALQYDAYGNVASETNPSVSDRFGFTGRERDAATGLSYYRARYYDTATGRFLSMDPLGLGAGDADLYRYVGNAPTNATDPTGLFPSFITDWVASRVNGTFLEEPAQWAASVARATDAPERALGRAVGQSLTRVSDAYQKEGVTAAAGTAALEGIRLKTELDPVTGLPLVTGQDAAANQARGLSWPLAYAEAELKNTPILNIPWRLAELGQGQELGGANHGRALTPDEMRDRYTSVVADIGGVIAGEKMAASTQARKATGTPEPAVAPRALKPVEEIPGPNGRGFDPAPDAAQHPMNRGMAEAEPVKPGETPNCFVGGTSVLLPGEAPAQRPSQGPPVGSAPSDLLASAAALLAGLVGWHCLRRQPGHKRRTDEECWPGRLNQADAGEEDEPGPEPPEWPVAAAPASHSRSEGTATPAAAPPGEARPAPFHPRGLAAVQAHAGTSADASAAAARRSDGSGQGSPAWSMLRPARLAQGWLLLWLLTAALLAGRCLLPWHRSSPVIRQGLPGARIDLPASKPIEAIQVGERVWADSPDGPTPEDERVDPATWRRLRFRGDWRWADGTPDVVNVETLQPPEWLAAHEARVGSRVPLPADLAELGFPEAFRAEVLANEPCPPLPPDPGHLVLTTVNHLHPDVRELTFQDDGGQRGSVRPTAIHRFYREGDGCWVPAEELRLGERVRGRSGPLTLVASVRLPGVQRVYNLTVSGPHVYYVSGVGVLTHNASSGPGNGPIGPPTPQAFIKQYRQRFPSGTYTDAELRQTYVEGKVLDPQTGRVRALRATDFGKVQGDLADLVKTGQVEDLAGAVDGRPGKETIDLVRRFSGKITNSAGEVVQVKPQSTGAVFLRWFKKNILGDLEFTGTNVQRVGQSDLRFDNFLPKEDAARLGPSFAEKDQVFELKNFQVDSRSFDAKFWTQAKDYAKAADGRGAQLNYVFSQTVNRADVVSRLNGLGIKTFVINDDGLMISYPR